MSNKRPVPGLGRGLSALMDESASAELRRHAKARVLVIDPDVLSS